jgi:hypothetical protein
MKEVPMCRRVVLLISLVLAALRGAAAASLPFTFERNVGQTDARVEFLSRGRGHTLFLTADGAVMALDCSVLTLRLEGARQAVEISGVGPLRGTSHYYGRAEESGWEGHAPHFAAVRYRGVYPGVDLVFRGSEGRLEYDFVVAPGADPRVLIFDGAEESEIDAGGRLILRTPSGPVTQHPPVIYEETGGARRELAGRYVRTERGIGFEIAGHDPRAELVIDPVVVYSTYLGGAPGGGGGFADNARDGADFAIDVAADAAGNAYMIGVISSPDFPKKNAVYSRLDGFNPWIAKLGPDGQLVYATYLPGSKGSLNPRAGFNGGTGVAVDSKGNAYFGGITQSTVLPVTPQAFKKKYGGGLIDAFIVKLDPEGKLVYLSYLGGSDFDTVSCLALDAKDDLYVSGTTSSDDFPIAGGVQARRKGGNVFGGLDVFVTKVKPAGDGVIYSTFVGGSGDEATSGLAVDPSGSAVLTGWTSSTDFPLVNPFQATHKGGVSRSFGIPTDVFVTRLSPDGAQIRYSTFLGGSGPEYPDPDNFTRRVAVDAEGNAYIISDTASTDFPTTENALQGTYGGGASDAFLTKLNSTGGLMYSTFLGGSGSERGRSIVRDAQGNIYIAGQTGSADFRTVHPVQDKLNGPTDAFVVKLTPDGRTLLFSTYLGGDDGALGIALARGDIFVAGSTFSRDFPTTPDALQGAFGGPPEDAFFVRISEGGTAVFPVALAKGVNLISVPLKPAMPFTARSLAALTGATMVIRFDDRTQRFVGFSPEDSGDGFPIEGGKGYFVAVPAARQVQFVGSAWSAGPAGPPLAGPGSSLEDVLSSLQVELERLVKRE